MMTIIGIVLGLILSTYFANYFSCKYPTMSYMQLMALSWITTMIIGLMLLTVVSMILSHFVK